MPAENACASYETMDHLHTSVKLTYNNTAKWIYADGFMSCFACANDQADLLIG